MVTNLGIMTMVKMTTILLRSNMKLLQRNGSCEIMMTITKGGIMTRFRILNRSLPHRDMTITTECERTVIPLLQRTIRALSKLPLSSMMTIQVRDLEMEQTTLILRGKVADTKEGNDNDPSPRHLTVVVTAAEAGAEESNSPSQLGWKPTNRKATMIFRNRRFARMINTTTTTTLIITTPMPRYLAGEADVVVVVTKLHQHGWHEIRRSKD
jgi:hypothetical protein